MLVYIYMYMYDVHDACIVCLKLFLFSTHSTSFIVIHADVHMLCFYAIVQKNSESI